MRHGWGATRVGRRPVVVLSPGWVGDAVLVRLLDGGGIDAVGHALHRRVEDPVDHLVRRLDAHGRWGRRAGAVVRPADLFVANDASADAVVAALRARGVVVLAHRRASHADRGLHRALSGRDTEVLPPAPALVADEDVAVYEQESEWAAAWIDVQPVDARLVFEEDLATGPGREALVGRLAPLLGVVRWVPCAERDVPSHDLMASLRHAPAAP